MSLRKTNQIIDELSKKLFIVEGEVTDLMTHETMQNLNVSSQNTTGAIAVGSALLGQIGTAALANFAASDEGIEVSDFAIEVTDPEGLKHYFTGCFPVVLFKKGDLVKVVAEPYTEKYARAVAVIDQENHYIWTSQQIIKGRIRYRIFGMKLMGGVCLFVLFAQFVLDYFIAGSMSEMLFSDTGIQITALIAFIVFTGIGWRIGGSFDEQSIEFEAILRKLDFNKPSMASLNNYSVFAINRKNKIKMDEYPDRWEQYTYHLDLAQKADADKYGKK